MSAAHSHTARESLQQHFPVSAHTSDGVPYRIRPLRPDDADRERDFIHRLSPTSRYQRFMHSMREPADSLIERLVSNEYPRSLALAAAIDERGSERIIGVARYSAVIGVARYSADNDRECEFAVAVADDWQCRGVATTLVPLLFECAARAGFETVYGTVLAANQRMIELAQWLGLSVDAARPGETTVRAWRRLRPAHTG
jgi:acetyltransferase